MKEYFKLQYKILNSKMNDVGLSPILGYLLAIIGFYGISIYLLKNGEFIKHVNKEHFSRLEAEMKELTIGGLVTKLDLK